MMAIAPLSSGAPHQRGGCKLPLRLCIMRHGECCSQRSIRKLSQKQNHQRDVDISYGVELSTLSKRLCWNVKIVPVRIYPGQAKTAFQTSSNMGSTTIIAIWM